MPVLQHSERPRKVQRAAGISSADIALTTWQNILTTLGNSSSRIYFESFWQVFFIL